MQYYNNTTATYKQYELQDLTCSWVPVMIVYKPIWHELWYSKAPLRGDEERTIGQEKNIEINVDY